jgi:nucleoside-diphosphate-sugar epimerase
MKILVTGGSGFIGTNLVTDLLDVGHTVSIYDKTKSKTYPDLCIVADVRDRKKLTEAGRGIDVVYHLAAEHRDDVRPFSLYYDVNVGGAENLAHAAEQNNVKKIIFTSSVAIYGLNAGAPNEESPIKPFNYYSRSKYQSEKVFNEWARGDNSRCLVIVRPVVIFGENNRGNVYELLSQIASSKFVMVGNGKNEKSMGYVLNLSGFLTKILESGPGGHVYNYADKPDMTMEELVGIASEALGNGPEIKWKIPYSIGLLGGYAFDILARITGKTYPISSIRIKKFVSDTKVAADRLRETGFVAPYSLAEGLERMIASEFLQESD